MKSNKDDLELKKSLSKYWPAGKNFHSSSISFIKRYQNKIIVIKYGGYALTKNNLMKSFSKNIALLNKVGIKTIIVHGGGPQIEAELKKRKIKDVKFFEKIGSQIGVLFQIADDLIDYQGSSKMAGKKTGKDIKKGKATLISLLGYSNSIKYCDKIILDINRNLKIYGSKSKKLKDTLEFILNRNK